MPETKAEWLGNDNRKIMLKVKTTDQILPFKSGTALPSPAQAPGSQCATLFDS
jgi:hypothetical protein